MFLHGEVVVERNYSVNFEQDRLFLGVCLLALPYLAPLLYLGVLYLLA